MERAALPRTLVIPVGTMGHTAPTKKEFSEGWYEFTIAIGKDEVATVQIHEEGLRALKLIQPPATWL